MSDVKNFLIEARKISSLVMLDTERSDEQDLVLIFPTTPTFEEQLSIQRLITPGATTTPNIRVFGFPGESGKKMIIHLADSIH